MLIHERRNPKMSIPHLFRCPISLDLFTDPVTLCTGQTYDRPCIEKWISSGNYTCPVTMLKLHDLSMVPNRILSQLIHQWLDQTGIMDPGREHDEYLATLKQTLESQEPIWEKKLRALKQVKALSLELSCKENEGLVKLGFFKLLLEIVLGKESSFTQQRLELLEISLSIVIKLMPFSDLECLNILKDEPKMESLLALLENGSPLIKVRICHLLEVILSKSCSSQELKELSSLIRNSGEIQKLIINLIHDHLDGDNDDYDEEENAEVSEAGVKVMQALCLNCVNGNHSQSKKALEKLIQLGAINTLVRYIMKGLEMERGPGPGSVAMAALEILLEVEGGKEALLRMENGVKALVKMVFRVCDHQGSENAVNCLMGLCCEFVEARDEAVKNGVLTQLLLLLQSQCPMKTKTRARMMLKLLRTMWVKDPIGRKQIVG